jgi:hypothetical protein
MSAVGKQSQERIERIGLVFVVVSVTNGWNGVQM